MRGNRRKSSHQMELTVLARKLALFVRFSAMQHDLRDCDNVAGSIRPDEPKLRLPNEPNLTLCFQQKLQTKAKFPTSRRLPVRVATPRSPAASPPPSPAPPPRLSPS